MATFRMVHTEFWNDSKVIEEMTPEDKYFFLYLLTNPNTTQIGIYQITKKQMAFDMGYSMETVNSLLDRFTRHHGLVEYNPDTREIAIKNWGKFNLRRGGKPMLDCVRSELKEVKDISMVSYVGEQVENQSIREIYVSYYDTLHDTSDDTFKSSESTGRVGENGGGFSFPEGVQEPPLESEETSDVNGSYDTSTIRGTCRGQYKEEDKDKEEDKEYVGEIESTLQEKPEPKNKGRKQVYDEHSIYFQLANRLYQRILENNPDHKKPNLQNWANDVRLMMERDKRTQEQIVYLIDWVQQDSFWMKNVLSIAKLRERFDQLVMQVKSEKKVNNPAKPPNYEIEEGEPNAERNERNSKPFGNVQLFK